MKSIPTPPIPVRERHRQLTNAAILDAAFDLFQDAGLRATTIDQIATRAGINRATFYLHFKDKNEVAAALARRLVDIGQGQYRALAELSNPDRAQVRAWVVTHMAFAREQRMLSQTLVEAVSAEPGFAQEYLDYLGRIADLRLDPLLARVSPERRELLRSKLVLLQLMMTYSVHHLVSQELRFPGGDPVDALADMWWNEVFAPNAPPPQD
ncbi:MAG: TetR/AcrR family transcriptional regulator [Pseudomonadota bacterium]